MLDQVEGYKTSQVVSVICPLTTPGDIWRLEKLVCQNVTVLPVLTVTHQSDGLPGRKINDITSQGRFPTAEPMAQMDTNGTSSLLLTSAYLMLLGLCHGYMQHAPSIWYRMRIMRCPTLCLMIYIRLVAHGSRMLGARLVCSNILQIGLRKKNLRQTQIKRTKN